MKTLTILSTLAVSALLATAADAQQFVYPVNAYAPLQVFHAPPAPQVQIHIPAAAAVVQQAPVQQVAVQAAAPAPAAAPASASPVQVHGQNISITVDGAAAAHPQMLYPAAQPTVVPGYLVPQQVQPMMPTTYQPFPPDAQRAVNCLITTGGNYVTCGINEALSHVYAELAKCVTGVNVPGGCFAPKRPTYASRVRR